MVVMALAKEAMRRLVAKLVAMKMRCIPEKRLELPTPETDKDPRLVVSLTSYGDRLHTVHLAIRSVMAQTLKPDLVVLYIESTGAQLTKEIRRLEKRGLLVRRVADIKAHTKYYYAMQEFPNSDIVTIDDDMVYRKSLLENLVNSSKQFPGCIVANRVHKMKFDTAGNLLPYDSWLMEWTDERQAPRNSLLATGVGGVLYPRSCFGEIAFNIGLIQDLSFQADDLWLKAMEIKYGLPVVHIPNGDRGRYTIGGTQDMGLYHENVLSGANDAQLRKLFNYFHFSKADFDDEIRPRDT